jgi:CelD/BcsL family acetyltransferase involved in cellulose biosynthesis
VTTTAITTRVLDGFDDQTFGPLEWEELLARHQVDVVYLTWHWQRAWWETFQRGQLLLIVAEHDGRAVALAPLYFQSGMIYFLGTGVESGFLDFVGDINDAAVLEALLATARAVVPEFLGFRFHFVPDTSSTGDRLQAAAKRLGLSCYDEDEVFVPVLDLVGEPQAGSSAVRKKDMLRHESVLRREGSLEIRHLQKGTDILPQLPDFFEQSIARWAVTAEKSRFANQKVRTFFERLTQVAADAGWLRFTRLDWDGRPIAFHYGFCYRGRYYWEMPSFAIDQARRSPGTVLLRQTLLAAIEEKAAKFDFGFGRRPYKLRLATGLTRLRTWGLFPSSASTPQQDGSN